jgi:hypothetical protein
MLEEAKRHDPDRLCSYASESRRSSPERDVAGRMDFIHRVQIPSLRPPAVPCGLGCHLHAHPILSFRTRTGRESRSRSCATLGRRPQDGCLPPGAFLHCRSGASTFRVSCLIALVDDHPTRGTKSILRYGWSLQDLANDAAGTFVENTKKVARTATRIGEMVAPFRLVALETVKLPPGRQSSSVTGPSALRCMRKRPLLPASLKPC